MPSNRKKRKTTHANTNGGQLSQAEIWDDSALIRSWNDAVAEYDFYHSIHAKGEDVDEVLRGAETGEDEDGEIDGREVGDNGGWRPVNEVGGAGAGAADEGTVNAVGVEAQSAEAGDDEDGEIQESKDAAATGEGQLGLLERRAEAMKKLESVSEQPDGSRSEELAIPWNGPSAKQMPSKSTVTKMRAAPGATNMTAQSHDQTLENVKMAYYWAGYYSGLYDGQRQAQNPP